MALGFADKMIALRLIARAAGQYPQRGRTLAVAPSVDGCNRLIVLVAASSGEGLLTERRTAAQPWRHELAFMPRSRPSPERLKPLRRSGGILKRWMVYLMRCRARVSIFQNVIFI